MPPCPACYEHLEPQKVICPHCHYTLSLEEWEEANYPGPPLTFGFCLAVVGAFAAFVLTVVLWWKSIGGQP